MPPRRLSIAANPPAGDTGRWKAALPTVGDSEATPTLVSISAECGYEKYVIGVSVRAWQRIVDGELVVVKRLVSVGDAIVPCEWHFNRYQRGNLFVDWGHGDLRFWIGLEAVDIRRGEQALLWDLEQPLVPPLKDGPSAFFKNLWECCRPLWAFRRGQPYRADD